MGDTHVPFPASWVSSTEAGYGAVGSTGKQSPCSPFRPYSILYQPLTTHLVVQPEIKHLTRSSNQKPELAFFEFLLSVLPKSLICSPI